MSADTHRSAITDQGPTIHDNDFSEVSPGHNPIADIVFVHGLQGHPKNTWTYKNSEIKNTNRPNIMTLLKRKGKTHRTDSTDEHTPRVELFWPSDLLASEVKDVRILTYGYDSRVSKFFSGPSNQNNISAHGKDLLYALDRVRGLTKTARMKEGNPTRPIIFVAHSLGGIILKEALRRSKEAPPNELDLRKIYEYTEGIIFLGTPHRGSSYGGWGEVLRSVADAAGFDANDRVLRDLDPESQYLGMLREEFSKMVDDKRMRFYSFQESRGWRGSSLFGMNRKVVDDYSSALDHARERQEHIDANHQNICRFRSGDDEGYVKVLSAIQKYLESVREKLHIKKEDECLEALDIPDVDTRQQSIEEPYARTFDWIWTNTSDIQFWDWLEGGRGIYWIRGKPGSGKSTIMNHIMKSDFLKKPSKAKSRKFIKAGFFFNDRGPDVQKSLRGLLCSLLRQILSQQRRFIKSTWHYLLDSGSEKEEVKEFTEDDLEQAILALTSSTNVDATVCLFIDALDEFHGNNKELLHLAQFLKKIACTRDGSVHTQICLSSREINTLQDAFGDCHGLLMHQLTKPDILKYVKGRLDNHPVADRSGFQKRALRSLIQKIVESALGVFLWVKLVVDQCEEGLTEGDTFNELEKVIDSLPHDLEQLYVRILQRVKDSYRDEAYMMIQVVACAFEPLSAEVFWYLVRHALEVQGDITLEMLRRRIKRCGGLIEVNVRNSRDEFAVLKDRSTGSSSIVFERPWNSPGQVQFLHQTAKDFAKLPENLRPLVDHSRPLRKDGYSWLFRAGVDAVITSYRKCSSTSNFDTHNESERGGAIAINVGKILNYARLVEDSLSFSVAKPLHDLSLVLNKCTSRTWARKFALLASRSPELPILFKAFIFEDWEPPRTLLCIITCAGLKHSAAEMMKTSMQSESRHDFQSLLYYAIRLAISDSGFVKAAFGTSRYFLELYTSRKVWNDCGRRLSALSHFSERLLHCGDSFAEKGPLSADEEEKQFVAEIVEKLLQNGSPSNQRIIYNLKPSDARKTMEEEQKLARELQQQQRFLDFSGNPNSYLDPTVFLESAGFEYKLTTTQDWYLPIHALVRLDSIPILELLENAGADLQANDSLGRRAIDIAEYHECYNAKEWLAERLLAGMSLDAELQFGSLES